MKILVTGAGGLLAHAALPVLRAAGHDVRPLTRAEADVAHLPSLLAHAREYRPDWVLHLAAFTHVDQCEAEPEKAFVVNGLGPRNSSIAAAEVGAAVMALSTDYVFDGASATPRREHDPIGPLGVYGKSKLAGERGAREVNPRHVIVRTAWLYGAGGRNFVDTIVGKARAGEPLRVVDDQRGAPTWTHDLAEAMLALIERREFGTYHVTNSGNCTWYDLAVAACAEAGVSADIARISSDELARPAHRPAYSALHMGWFEHVAGRRMPEWRDALRRYLASSGGARGKES